MKDNPPAVLATRRFTHADQNLFARLSGDINPIHMDEIAARRFLPGAVIVHGVHTFLWSLEALVGSKFGPASIRGFEVRFPKPAYLDDEVTLTLQNVSPEKLNLMASVGIKTIAIIGIDCSSAVMEPNLTSTDSSPIIPASGEPKIVSPDIAYGKSGRVDFAAIEKDFSDAFPRTAEFIGASRLQAIAACSRLVGMECPGLYSIFSSLSGIFTGKNTLPHLAYEVIGVDDRFRLIRMNVAGAGLEGRVEAFSPPTPPQQLSIRDIAKMIKAKEFAGQTALIIGGSRGLGELVAKIIAAGGGRAFITYAAGYNDATRIVEEIREFGGHAEMLSYDVTKPAGEQLKKLGNIIPTHIYYFATCPIFRAKTKSFDGDLLVQFVHFYVDGFNNLCQEMKERGTKILSIFYPSSVAVDEQPRDLAEYVEAKMAGESLCADLTKTMPEFRILMRRLPRLLTDQTATLTPLKLPQAIDIILPIIRTMEN
jgi:acyl dehydratase